MFRPGTSQSGGEVETTIYATQPSPQAQAAPKDSILLSTFKKVIQDKFHLLYSCFFKIIRDRLARLQRNEDGRIDELMYKEQQGILFLLDPKHKKRRNRLDADQLKWLEDYIFLPSHSTYKQQEKMLEEFGTQSLFIEKDFKLFAGRIAELCENEVLEKLPDLKELLKLLEVHMHGIGDSDQGLFGMTKNDDETQMDNQATTMSLYDSTQFEFEQSELSSLNTQIQHELKQQREKMMIQEQKNNSDRLNEKLQLRELYMQQMIDTAKVGTECDADYINKLQRKLMHMNNKVKQLKRIVGAKGEQIKLTILKMQELESKNNFYNIQFKENKNLKQKIQKLESENLKLRQRNKSMTMTYSQEIQANRVQHMAALKSKNDRYLNSSNIVKISFFDECQCLDDDLRSLLNFKLEEMQQDCHHQIAQLIKENERKEMQIHSYKQLAPELYSLAQYSIEEIIEHMPVISTDMDQIWNLMLATFGENCFTSNIIRRFPKQFQGDINVHKDELQKWAQGFSEQIIQLRKKAEADLSESNAEFQICSQESETYQRLFNIEKAKNSELRIRIRKQGKDYADYVDATKDEIFKNKDEWRKIQFFIIREKSKYESIIERLYNEIGKLSSQLNQQKQEFQAFLASKVEKNSMLRQLEIQIFFLEKQIAQNDDLTNELLKDKEQIMHVLKREAPSVYRQFQLDVFTDFSIYKQRVIRQHHKKLQKASTRLARKMTKDQKVGTDIQNVLDNNYRYFKQDEFHRIICLDKLEQLAAQTQTEETVQGQVWQASSQKQKEKNTTEAKAEEMGSESEASPAAAMESEVSDSAEDEDYSLMNLKKDQNHESSNQQMQAVQTAQLETSSLGVQCDLPSVDQLQSRQYIVPVMQQTTLSSEATSHDLNPTKVQVQVRKSFDLSNDYMENLLTAMNQPDPRQLNYLERQRRSFDLSKMATKNMLKIAKLESKDRQQRKQEDSKNSVYDIGNVENRLMSHGKLKAHRQLKIRSSFYHKNEPIVQKSVPKKDGNSPMSLSLNKDNEKSLNDSLKFKTLPLVTKDGKTAEISAPLVSKQKLTTNIMNNQQTKDVKPDPVNGNVQVSLIGLFKKGKEQILNQRRQTLTHKRQRGSSIFVQKVRCSQSDMYKSSQKQNLRDRKRSERRSLDCFRNTYDFLAANQMTNKGQRPKRNEIGSETKKDQTTSQDRGLNDSGIWSSQDERELDFAKGNEDSDLVDKQLAEIDHQNTRGLKIVSTNDFQQLQIKIIDNKARSLVESEKDNESSYEQQSLDPPPHGIEDLRIRSNIPKPSFLNNKKRELFEQIEIEKNVCFQPLNLISAQKVMQQNPKKQQEVMFSYSKAKPLNNNNQARNIIKNYNIVNRSLVQTPSKSTTPSKRCAIPGAVTTLMAQALYDKQELQQHKQYRSRTAAGRSRQNILRSQVESSATMQKSKHFIIKKPNHFDTIDICLKDAKPTEHADSSAIISPKLNQTQIPRDSASSSLIGLTTSVTDHDRTTTNNKIPLHMRRQIQSKKGLTNKNLTSFVQKPSSKLTSEQSQNLSIHRLDHKLHNNSQESKVEEILSQQQMKDLKDVSEAKMFHADAVSSYVETHYNMPHNTNQKLNAGAQKYLVSQITRVEPSLGHTNATPQFQLDSNDDVESSFVMQKSKSSIKSFSDDGKASPQLPGFGLEEFKETFNQEEAKQVNRQKRYTTDISAENAQ